MGGNKRRPFPSSKGHFCQRRSAKAFAFARQCSENSKVPPTLKLCELVHPFYLLRSVVRKGRGETKTPLPGLKRSLLTASFRKGFRLCPTMLQTTWVPPLLINQTRP